MMVYSSLSYRPCGTRCRLCVCQQQNRKHESLIRMASVDDGTGLIDRIDESCFSNVSSRESVCGLVGIFNGNDDPTNECMRRLALCR